MPVVELEQAESSEVIRELQLSEILKRRMGDRYKIDLGETYTFQTRVIGGGSMATSIVTVRRVMPFRINLKILDDQPGCCVSVSPDVASEFLFKTVFIFTFSLGYWPMMLLAWLFTRRLEGDVLEALAPVVWDEQAQQELAPLQGPGDGPPRVYYGHAATKLAYPVFATVFDVLRAVASGGLLAAILFTTTGLFCRQLSNGTIHGDFVVAIFFVGLSVASLAAGIMGFTRRPLYLWDFFGLWMGASALYAGILAAVAKFFY